ncbi:hypothetical protein WJX81_008560 [Elliptochloris bilobata]|uniref:Uncharacterized protein n=1 Tax=Elliptochloris bilobata TaxID=381761 RepID=A0AAW1QDP3_9CHLO
MSCDGRPQAPVPRLSLDSLRSKGIWGTLAGEKALPVPVPAPKDEKAAAASRRRREKTIDDTYYTWSELVRSSSL